jgi:hypothetical protein
MTIDFVTLCAAYAAWQDPNFVEAAMTFGLLSPEEPCTRAATETPTWWPSAAEAARQCHLSERAVVLCTGLSTHDTYAAMRTQTLGSLTQCTIMGPASTSPAFRDTFLSSIREELLERRNAQLSLRELYHAAMCRLCKEWAREVALAAAASAPCLLLLPADMDFMLALCAAINDLYLPHFGVEVKHVYIGQTLESLPSLSCTLEPLSEPPSAPSADLSECRSECPSEPAPAPAEREAAEPHVEEPSRAHKTRSAREKKRRFAFWRYCSSKK